MSATAASKFRSIRDFPELVDYLGDELDWPIVTDDFEEMTFEYSAAELGLDEKTAPKFLEIRRLRPLDKDQPWGIFFIRFDDNKLPVVALRRLLSKLVLNKRSTSNSGDRASWHESDLLLISQTGNLGTQSISFAHFAANPEKTDLPILKVLGWDDDDTGLKIDYVIETLREKLVWPDDPTDSDAWRSQWREAFTLKNREVIQSSKEMAERLGQLALAVRTRLREVLAIENEEGPIHKMMSVFKENLISDLDTDSFSDMYAQTIAYGLLSARIINPEANTADAAYTQIPITNPFLRDLMETFLNVGGRSQGSGVALDFDELGINEVVDLLDNTNMEAVLRDFGDRNQKEDPVMHFFEGFLQEYDSKIRKDRGVFYTPQPVVSFIVRSVDEQLRMEFGLEDGLADTTTWGELAKSVNDVEIPEGTSPDQAFVQILDPATGTGTFPVEVIDLIYKTMAAKWREQGSRETQIIELWNDYVPEHLLPRLHGYELMMAPYAIAHMKIGLKLYETGYRFKSDQRARIYLTNALEPAKDFSETLEFAIPALAQEAHAVNSVKKDQRFTVILGNPPYLGEGGAPKGWIGNLIEDYKKEPGGQAKLNERNPKWLNDLYVKFIRLSSHLLEQSGQGVFGLITNHGYLDNPSFRGMRWNLLNVFERIWVLDLHGNLTKKEVTPEGAPDDNVFDIRTGVSIIFGLQKRNNATELATLMRSDFWGSRKDKYSLLEAVDLTESHFSKIQISSPQYQFVKRDYVQQAKYDQGFYLPDFMPVYGNGMTTARDSFAVGTKDELVDRMKALANDSETNLELLHRRHNIPKKSGWDLARAKRTIEKVTDHTSLIRPVSYRIFDKRSIYYHEDIVWRTVRKIGQHFENSPNFSLVTARQGQATGSLIWDTAFVSDSITDFNIFRRGGGPSFPLYLHPNRGELDQTRKVNFDAKLYKELSTKVNHSIHGKPNEVQTFDYIYGVLYCPGYRIKYADFLKTDFPKIPFPNNPEEFWDVSRKGSQLRKLHLMDMDVIGEMPYVFAEAGDNVIEKPHFTDEKIWINSKQYFSNVSKLSWDFYIGGYQPAQKWLKDRKGRELHQEDIIHYKKIIKILDETGRIMKTIEMAL